MKVWSATQRAGTPHARRCARQSASLPSSSHPPSAWMNTSMVGTVRDNIAMSVILRARVDANVTQMLSPDF